MAWGFFVVVYSLFSLVVYYLNKQKTRNVSETYMPPLVQNSKLLLICRRYYEFSTLYKAELNIIK